MTMPLTSGGQILLSLTLLLIALWIHHRNVRVVLISAAMLVAVLLSILLYALYFVSDYFTAEGINEAVIYHLRYGLSGAGFSEYAGISVSVVVGLVLIVALLSYVEFRKHSRLASGSSGRMQGSSAAALICAVLSLTANPAIADIYDLLFAGGMGSVSVTNFHNDPALNAEFEQFYNTPQLIQIKKQRPHLVFIYAESLERTYFDEKIFPGLTPRLKELETQATSFTNIMQAPGTGWTIGGMVASQCGIPLFTPSHGNSMSGLNKFLPAASCLGDMLKSEGYHLTYLGGAKKRFAGKGTFYETHQFDEISGSDELLPKLQDPAYVNAWGLYDDSLLDIAFEKYLKSAQARQKFGLFLLTLDTHHPNGHSSKKCEKMPYQDGKNPILNSVFCADYLLAEFINRIRHSPYGKDTVIVLMSDHLAMKNSAIDLLALKPRRNLFMILGPNIDQGRKLPTQGSTLDIGPTIAPFLGYKMQLGLGSDLMNVSHKSEARSRFIQDRLLGWREPISRFWGFPTIKEYIEVDMDKYVVRIDGQPISIPCFLEIDGQMETVIKFPGYTTSMDFVRQNPRDKAFLLLTECTARNPLLPQGKTCLFAGQGNQFHTQFVLHDKSQFSADEVRRMTGARP
ncbi:MAG: sulfatase-like hydrolase/transferase [Nitrosomonadales bacterium]|nr:sulfatase-like hydrolase/transferase [Nitrosomonadales bacterium]